MRPFYCFVSCLLIIAFLSSCSTSPDQKVTKVVAKDFLFETENQIESGWNTFRFINMGHADHFFLLNKLPDTISYTQYRTEVGVPFETVLDSLLAGMSQKDAVGLLMELVPQWFFTSVVQMGGTGIIGPGKSTEVTMKLDPGTYVMECYIKEKGDFHSTLGMIRSLKVLETSTGMEPPEPDYELTLTNFKYQSKGELGTGENIVAVHFKEQPQNAMGNDVQLIRMDESTNIDSVVSWLNWMNPKGMEPPAPAEFLGGSQEMPVGYTSYFKVNLQPGNYAWVGETSAAKGMVMEFSVE